MPPRRRGGNPRLRRGPLQYIAIAPAEAHQEAVPPIVQRLLPNEVPLFQTGQTGDQFWRAASEATYKQVPTAIVRNMNALAVNVWDLCGRKKTNRPNFQLEPKIKERILHFMGSTGEVGARHDPRLSTAALAAVAKAKQQEICDRILRNLIERLDGDAKKGFLFGDVKLSDVFPRGLGWGIPDSCKDAATREACDWYLLFDWLTPLRSTLEAAGFEADRSDPKQLLQLYAVDGENAGGTNQTTKVKVWKMRFHFD